jgi:thiol-disulfide isomerase/thioredoxin
MMKKILFTLVLLKFLTATAQTPLSTAVMFSAKDFVGVPHSLGDYLNDGKHVLLSFYTMNCGSCMAYSPHINQIYQNYGCNNADLIVLGVNWGANNFQLSQYHQQNSYSFPSLSGFEGYGNEINSDYEIQSFITVILIAPNSEILVSYVWPPSVSVIDSILNSHGVFPAPCTVGFDEQLSSGAAGIQIYPNPVEANFNIAAPDFAGEVELQMYDLHARLVHDYGKVNIRSANFSIPELKPGFYFLWIIDDRQNIYQKQIVITPMR